MSPESEGSIVGYHLFIFNKLGKVIKTGTGNYAKCLLCHRVGRSVGPNANGSKSVSKVGPRSVSMRSDGCACSISNCRQRPHGNSGPGCGPTQAKAINVSLLDPVVTEVFTKSLISPHSAHNVSPYEAFSTLQPLTMRPVLVNAAAPTGCCE